MMTSILRFAPARQSGLLHVLSAAIVAVTAVFALTAANTAWAQFGSAPIHLLVGFPPGGGSDAVARILSDKIASGLDATVIVENRGGAGGQIAAEVIKGSPADGHWIFLSHDHTISVLPQVLRHPGFDPARDFVALAGLATFANGLAVSGSTPVRNFDEYIAWVRQHGGKSAVGIPAPASIPEFLVKLINDKYHLDLKAVPYRGSAPMMADMLGNQIPAGIGSVQDFIENQKAGKIRMIVVLGNKRQPVLPDVPTFGELGWTRVKDLPYYGFFAPVGTPQTFIDRFNAVLAKALADPDIKNRLTTLGLTVQYMPQVEFNQRVRGYTTTWAKIIKDSGFKPQ